MITKGDRLINLKAPWSATVISVFKSNAVVKVNCKWVYVQLKNIKVGNKAGNWEVIS